MPETSTLTAILRQALPNLRAQWPIQSLALFGSRVRDDATPASDLDILVTFDHPVSLSSFLALEQTLSDLTDPTRRSRLRRRPQALYRRAGPRRSHPPMTTPRDHRDFPHDMVMPSRSILRFAEGMTL